MRGGLPVHELEQLLKQLEHATMTSDLQLRIFGRLSDMIPHLLHQLPKDVCIRNTQEDQYAGGHGSTDDSSNSTECAKFRADGCGCCSHRDGRDDDNTSQVSLDPWNEVRKRRYREWDRDGEEDGVLRRVAQREERSHCYRFLACSDQTAGDEIDDGDVVSIDCVTEPKRVCNDSCWRKVSEGVLMSAFLPRWYYHDLASRGILTHDNAEIESMLIRNPIC